MTPEQIEEIVQNTINSLKTAKELIEVMEKAQAFDRMQEAIIEKKRQGIVIERGDCANPYKNGVEAVFYRLIDKEAGDKIERFRKVVIIEMKDIICGWRNTGDSIYNIEVKGVFDIVEGDLVEIEGIKRKVLSVQTERRGATTIISY